LDRAASFLQVIQENYPDLAVHTVRLVSNEGQFNTILVVNDELIFRFPRYEQGIATLLLEINLLLQFRDSLPLPIPDPVYISLASPIPGKVFMGYRRVPGEPLWKPVFDAIQDHKILQGIASQLAQFLFALHTFPLEKLDPSFEMHDTMQEWVTLYRDIRENLFSFMRPAARIQTCAHFEAFLNSPESFDYKPGLRHGDFGTGNILYDVRSRRISGIIDFGSAGVGDPAVDLASVSCFGDSFYQRIQAFYPVTEAALQRAVFYKGTYALQEALHGWRHHDQGAFENGIAKYR
jgi:aminoglycoside 2''-phosphotransferase